MFDLLVVCGDSNSYGCECSGDHSSHPDDKNLAYGKHIQTSLNIKKYDNISIPGASNLEIFDATVEYIRSYTDDLSKVLLIVGWSEPQRVVYNLFTGPRRAGEFTMRRFLSESKPESQSKTVTDLIESFKGVPFITDFFKGTLAYVFGSDHFNYQNMLIKFSLDCFLRDKPLKYFTFPTLSDGMFKKYKMIRDLFTKNNMFEYNPSLVGSGFRDIKFDMLGWFSRYGVAAGGHLKPEAQKKLAEFLIDEMKRRKII